MTSPLNRHQQQQQQQQQLYNPNQYQQQQHQQPQQLLLSNSHHQHQSINGSGLIIDSLSSNSSNIQQYNNSTGIPIMNNQHQHPQSQPIYTNANIHLQQHSLSHPPHRKYFFLEELLKPETFFFAFFTRR